MVRSKKTKEFSFSSQLSSLGAGHMAVFIPELIRKKLPEGRVRTRGTINNTDFSLAVQQRKDGDSYFIIGGRLRREAKIREGDEVKLSFRVVDPDELELPEELRITLEQDSEAARVFDSFTTGLQRSLAYYIDSAKNVDTRIKRALDMAHKMKTGGLMRAPSRKKA
jgi:hypothetical protein